jgi:hypothetical protein
MNLSEMNPVEIDLVYLERLRMLGRARSSFDQAEQSLLYSCAKRVRAYGRTLFAHPDATDAEAAAGLRPINADGIVELRDSGRAFAGYMVAESFSRYESAKVSLAEAMIAVEEVNAEYAARPWPRFFLVTTSNGHVHRSTHCCTCNKGRAPTGFAIVPYLSGKDSAEAVAELGPALCSVCYPEAPVESREQVTISASVALALLEHGCDAFKAAREKAAAAAAKRSARRCDGTGAAGNVCPCCGYRSSGSKVRPHNRPVFHAYSEADYNRRYLSAAGEWGPSTKRAAFDTREAAQAAADAAGGGKVERR